MLLLLARSNRELYRVTCKAALLVGDCFVPRNDACFIVFFHNNKTPLPERKIGNRQQGLQHKT
jgi:hypothetical protein